MSALHRIVGQTLLRCTPVRGRHANSTPHWGGNVRIAPQPGADTSASHGSVGHKRQQRASAPTWGRNACIAQQRGADTSVTQTCVGQTAPHCPLARGKNVHSHCGASVGHVPSHCAPICCSHINSTPERAAKTAALHLNVGQTLLSCRPVWGRHVNSTPHWGKNVRIALQGGRGAEAPTPHLSASMG